MNDKTVYLSDVLDILESMEKEADKQGNYRGYIVLMDATERIQKLPEAKGHKYWKKELLRNENYGNSNQCKQLHYP